MIEWEADVAAVVTPTDLRVYVVNLPRRPDRRAWMMRALPPGLPVVFTSDWTGPFDGRDLTLAKLKQAGHELFSWRTESDNPWWSRPLKYGEVGCTLAHLACWRDAAETSSERFIVVLEDDVVLAPTFVESLVDGLGRLTRARSFDLVYLGRYPLEPEHDQPVLPGFVAPAYSHCTFGYVLTRRAVDVLLTMHIECAIVPIDEFLPSLYIDHPRADLRARFPRRLTALAFDPPLVQQRPKGEAGSDTEDSDFVPH